MNEKRSFSVQRLAIILRAKQMFTILTNRDKLSEFFRSGKIDVTGF